MRSANLASISIREQRRPKDRLDYVVCIGGSLCHVCSSELCLSIALQCVSLACSTDGSTLTRSRSRATRVSSSRLHPRPHLRYRPLSRVSHPSRGHGPFPWTEPARPKCGRRGTRVTVPHLQRAQSQGLTPWRLLAVDVSRRSPCLCVTRAGHTR